MHISEDPIIGANQSHDALYHRVVEEAKCRYRGDFSRSPVACRSRWRNVSKEVSKFCAAHKLVASVEHSGWNEDDYYEATVKAYQKMGTRPKVPPEGDNSGDEVVVVFPYKAEWEILRHHDKWASFVSQSLPKCAKSNMNADLSSGDSDADAKDAIVKVEGKERPVGNKKAKLMHQMKSETATLVSEMRKTCVQSQKMTEQIEKLKEDMVQCQREASQKLEAALGSSTKSLTDRLDMKMLLDLGMSNYAPHLTEQAMRTVQQHLHRNVFQTPPSDSVSVAGCVAEAKST